MWENMARHCLFGVLKINWTNVRFKTYDFTESLTLPDDPNSLTATGEKAPKHSWWSKCISYPESVCLLCSVLSVLQQSEVIDECVEPCFVFSMLKCILCSISKCCGKSVVCIVLMCAGSQAQQHCGKIWLHTEDSGLWLGTNSRHRVHDDTLCRHTVL